MSWILAFKNFTNDTARQVQFFMVCRQLGIIFSSIVLAWFLTVDSVGVIEMLMFSGYLMTFFWSDALLRSYLSSKHLQNEGKEVTSFFMLIFLVSLISMIILLVGQRMLIPLFTSRPDLDGLGLFALYQVLVVPIWIAPFIGLLKGQNILLASLFVLIGPAFACWTGYQNLPGIDGVLLGLFCYALVGFVWVLTKTTLKQSIRIKNILNIVWPATWPLILYSLSNGLARSFDAWLVARHFDESTFAIFRYGAREFPLVVALSAGLSAVMIPRLFNSLSFDELKSRSVRLMHSSYPLVGLLLLTSYIIFEIIYGRSYIMSASIFNVYLLLTLMQLVFPQSILTARGDTKILWYVSLFELAINIAASIILMQYLGLVGIAWGTLIAFTFEKIVLLVIIHKRYSIKPSMIVDMRVWGAYAFILVMLYIISEWLIGI